SGAPAKLSGSAGALAQGHSVLRVALELGYGSHTWSEWCAGEAKWKRWCAGAGPLRAAGGAGAGLR
ncbi:hypothetical protein CJ738_36760, partial [Klebsiella pneumoniae]